MTIAVDLGRKATKQNKKLAHFDVSFPHVFYFQLHIVCTFAHYSYLIKTNLVVINNRYNSLKVHLYTLNFCIKWGKDALAKIWSAQLQFYGGPHKRKANKLNVFVICK